MTQYSGVYTLQQQGQALTSGQWATDPYYKNTTLLLHADGVAGGAQNNTFLDSSTNAFAITRNGNTTQGSFTPYGPDWSNYFPSGSMLSTAYSSVFDFGTGDFTMEAWVNLDALPAPQTIFSCVDSGATVGYSLLILANGFVEVDVVAAQSFICNSNPVPIGKWTHVAFTKSSGTYRAFVNGSLCTTSSNTLGTTINSTSQGMCVGRSVASGYNFPLAGYISNARIVKGTAMYTSSFTPSTTPLTAVSGTSLLTCQSNGFKDAGLSYLPLTVTSTPSVQRFSPFPPQYQYTPAVIGGSGYFDGTGDYLSAAANAAFQFGTGDFCIEYWYYPTSFPNYTTTINSGYTSGGGYVVQAATDGKPYFYTGGATLITATTAYLLNAWNHFVVCRSGTTLSMFINGVRVGTTTDSTNYNLSAELDIGIGSTYPIYGYMGDVRLVKGASVYTPSSTTITVPTAPLTAIANTSLLLNMTNAGIYDNAMMNNLETVGNAQVSTSVVKYGSGSISIAATGDRLQTWQSNPNLVFGTGDFTIECWVYLSSLSTENGVFQISATAGGLYASNLDNVSIYSTGTTSWDFTAANGYRSGGIRPVANTWTHLALVRSSGVTKLYVNGVFDTTAGAIADTQNYSGGYICLGSEHSTSSPLLGYIDDFRVTKGVARYTGNFIPPKVAMPNQ